MAVPLGDVGGVEPRVADGDENVVARRRRRRPLLEGDDLVAACTGEDDRAHARAERMRRRSGRGRYRAASSGLLAGSRAHLGGPRACSSLCPNLEGRATHGTGAARDPRARGGRRVGDRRGSRSGAEPARHLEPARRRRDGGEPAGRARDRRCGRDRRRTRGRRARRARERRAGGGRDAGGRLPPLLRARRAGNAGAARRRAVAEPRSQAGLPVVRRGRVPADRLPHRLPHALRPRPPAAGPVRARAGRGRRRRDRGDPPRPRGRASRST